MSGNKKTELRELLYTIAVCGLTLIGGMILCKIIATFIKLQSPGIVIGRSNLH